MRISVRTMFVLGAALALNACQEPAPADQTVLFVHYFTGSLASGIDELTDTFNAMPGGITLSPTPLDHESFKSAIRLQLEGPNPPDIFSYWAGARTSYLVEKGLLAPVDELMNKPAMVEQFGPALLDALAVNGKACMVPMTRHYVALFYNPRVFAEAGLEPPRSWDDLLLVVDTLRQRGLVPIALGARNQWPAQFWFDYILLRGAPATVREDLVAGRLSYASAPVRQALERWATLVERGAFNKDLAIQDWDQAMQMVLDGQAGMTLMGSWVLGYCSSRNAVYSEDYDFCAFPVLDPAVPTVSLGPIDGVVLAKGARSPQAAMQVLARLADPQVQESFNIQAGSIPPNQQVSLQKFPPAQQRIAAEIAASAGWAFNYDLSTPPHHASAGLQMFMDFLANPERVDELCRDLDTAIAAGASE